MTNRIHPSAVVHRSAVLGDRNVVGPNAIIAAGVVVGDDNWIGPFCSIGLPGDVYGSPTTAEAAWWVDEAVPPAHAVRLGDRNVLKEGVTVHAGTHRTTSVDDDCYLMPRSHLGHDCWLASGVQLAPTVQVAGHVAIGERAVVGMGALVHQYSSIAPVAMVGMGTHVRGAVPVARTVVGERAQVAGLNRVGLARFFGEVELDPALVVAVKRQDEGAYPERLRAACMLNAERVVVQR